MIICKDCGKQEDDAEVEVRELLCFDCAEKRIEQELMKKQR